MSSQNVFICQKLVAEIVWGYFTESSWIIRSGIGLLAIMVWGEWFAPLLFVGIARMTLQIPRWRLARLASSRFWDWKRDHFQLGRNSSKGQRRGHFQLVRNGS